MRRYFTATGERQSIEGNFLRASSITGSTSSFRTSSVMRVECLCTGLGIRDIGESSQSELWSWKQPDSLTRIFAPVMYLRRSAVSSVRILYGFLCGIQLYHSCARCEPHMGSPYWR